MDIFKIALKTIAQWMMLIGLVGLADAETTLLYQQALVAEKSTGNLEAALQLYERVVADATGDAWVMNQARERVALLRERLGLPKWVDPNTSPNVTTSLRQLLFHREQNDGRSLPYLNAIDQQFSGLRSRLGIDRSLEDGKERAWIEIQFHKIRKALGIQSFAEKLTEAAERRRRLRPMSVSGLFQAGLDAEKGAGDFEAAIEYYRRALEKVTDEKLKIQIQNRLVFCQRQVKL